ncbi:MAG: uroporphyrinogen-III C-methyltransferase [Phycisphaerae bacterium]
MATVYLVGAGPGDPGLLTVAGAEALRRADVVVYDYLANAALLNLAPSGAERIYVGKSANQHTKTQEQINAILVEQAKRAGVNVVVRLKGGDPYVFGRGGEEGEYLRANGVAFVEVPGITSGIAAPAYAGIPVTHRDFTSTITLITGHEKENSEFRVQNSELEEGGTRVNYEALAKLNGTLVFYMGVKGLPLIVERLVAGGLDPGTPAAVVRGGTHPKQRTVVGTVGTIAAEVERAGITAPAITIIGKVVSLRSTLNWFEERPLFGKRVLVTRTRQQASELAGMLAERGAQVMEVPTIEIVPPEDWEPIDQRLLQMPAYDWVVFTSANGVRAAWERLRELGFDARHFAASSVAAVGPATARALEEIGIVADVIPERFTGDEVVPALKAKMGEEEIRGHRFMLLRADIARPALREGLEKLGGMVEDVAIYQTKRPERLPEEVVAAIEAGEVEWVTFTSASTATNLWELLTPGQRAKVGGMKRVSMGPLTTAAMKTVGSGEWAPTVEAREQTIAGVVEAMVEAERR